MKKTYQSPTLEVYGSVESITLGPGAGKTVQIGDGWDNNQNVDPNSCNPNSAPGSEPGCPGSGFSG